MPDVEVMLRDLGERLEAAYPDPDPHALMTRPAGATGLLERPLSPPTVLPEGLRPGPLGWRRARRWRRPVWVAVAAAVLALLLVGVVPLIFERLRGDVEPAEPVTTTTTVAPDETTLPPQTTTTVAPQTTTSGVPETTTTAAAVGGVPAVPAMDGWRPVLPEGGYAAGGARVVHVEATDFGVVALGEECAELEGGNVPVGCVSVACVSADGLDWSEATNTGLGDVIDLAAGGPGLVAAGRDCETGPDGEVMCAPAIWTSPDGLQWSPNRLESAVPGLCDEGELSTPTLQSLIGPLLAFTHYRGCGARTIGSGPQGLLAAGYDEDGFSVWASPDGVQWAKSTAEDEIPVCEGCTDVQFSYLVALGSRWVALGHTEEHFLDSRGLLVDQANPGAVWISDDGATWVGVDGLGGFFGDYFTGYDGAVVWRDQLFVVGSFISNSGGVDVNGILTSPDGEEWSVLYETEPYDELVMAGLTFAPRRLFATADTLVFTGYRMAASQVGFGPAVWLTSPNGVEWTARELDPELFNDRPGPSFGPWPVWDLAEFDGLLITPGGSEPMPYSPQGEMEARDAAPSPQILVWAP